MNPARIPYPWDLPKAIHWPEHARTIYREGIASGRITLKGFTYEPAQKPVPEQLELFH